MIPIPLGFMSPEPPPLEPYTAADFQADLDFDYDRQWLSEDGLTGGGGNEWVDRANGVVATVQGTITTPLRNGIPVMSGLGAGSFVVAETYTGAKALLAMVWNDDAATFSGFEGILGVNNPYLMIGTGGGSGIYHFGVMKYGEITNGADFSGQNVGYLPRPNLSVTLIQHMGVSAGAMTNYEILERNADRWNGGARAILMGPEWVEAGRYAREMSYLMIEQGTRLDMDRSIPYKYRPLTKEPPPFNAAGRALCARTPALPWAVSDLGVDSQSAIFGMPEFVTDQGDRLILGGVSMIDVRSNGTGNPLNPDMTAWTKAGASTTVVENVDGVGVDTNTYTITVQEATTLEFNVGALSGNRAWSIMGILRSGAIPAGAEIQFYNGATPVNVPDALDLTTVAYKTIYSRISATSDRCRLTLPHTGSNYTIEVCRAMAVNNALTTDEVRPWSKAGNYIALESAGLAGSAGNTCYTFSAAGTIGVVFQVTQNQIDVVGHAKSGVLLRVGNLILRHDPANGRIGLDNGTDAEFFCDLDAVAGFNMAFFTWDGADMGMWTKDGTASISTAVVPATGNSIFLGNNLSVAQINGLIGIASWHESVLTPQNMSDILAEKAPLLNQELTRLSAITGPV